MKKLYLLTTTAALVLSAGVARAAELTAPFSFPTTQENFDKCTVLNVNGDDRTWKFNSSSSGTFNYQYKSENGADDWVILPAATFAAGVYDLEFAYKTQGNDAECFAFYIGDAPTVEGMTQEICRYEEVMSTADFTPVTHRFTVAEAGDKYIGIYCFSPKNRYNLYIKAIEVKTVDGTLPAAATLDVEMEYLKAHCSVTLPQTDVSDTPITTPVSIDVTVDGEAYTPAEALTGAAGATLAFDVELTVGTHVIAVTPSYMLGDALKTGEKTESAPLKAERYYPLPMPLPAAIAPDSQDAGHAVFINPDDDDVEWEFYSPTYDDPLANTFRFNFSYYNDGDDWLVLPQMLTEAGGAYKLAFDIRTVEENDIDIYWGTEPTVAAMTNLVGQLESFDSRSEFVRQEFDFGIPAGTNIYIGIQCKSKRGSNYIGIKNITLETTTGKAPLAPEIKAVDFDGADGTITVTAPLNNISAELIDGNVTLTLNVDGEDVESKECTPGADVTFDLTGMALGQHVAKVKASVTVVDEEGASTTYSSQNVSREFKVTPVYTLPMEFVPTIENFGFVTVINANADDNVWTKYIDNSVDVMRCSYNGKIAMDDWAILPPVVIEKAGTYRMTFVAYGNNDRFLESVEMTIGQGATVADQTRVLYKGEHIASKYYEPYEVEFEIDTPGRYYIGVHGISDPDMSYLMVGTITLDRVVVPVYAAPEGLDAQLNAARTEVSLTWSVPAFEAAELKGYNVYRNDVKINAELVTETSYTDTDMAAADGNPSYSVTAVYADGEGELESEPTEKITAMTTGVDAVAAAGLTVESGNGMLRISGAAGLRVRVVSITGATVADLTAGADTVDITLGAGVYIVLADGNAAVKAVVK